MIRQYFKSEDKFCEEPIPLQETEDILLCNHLDTDSGCNIEMQIR